MADSLLKQSALGVHYSQQRVRAITKINKSKSALKNLQQTSPILINKFVYQIDKYIYSQTKIIKYG
jgi:hypothetical protein